MIRAPVATGFAPRPPSRRVRVLPQASLSSMTGTSTGLLFAGTECQRLWHRGKGPHSSWAFAAALAELCCVDGGPSPVFNDGDRFHHSLSAGEKLRINLTLHNTPEKRRIATADMISGMGKAARCSEKNGRTGCVSCRVWAPDHPAAHRSRFAKKSRRRLLSGGPVQVENEVTSRRRGSLRPSWRRARGGTAAGGGSRLRASAGRARCSRAGRAGRPRRRLLATSYPSGPCVGR